MAGSPVCCGVWCVPLTFPSHVFWKGHSKASILPSIPKYGCSTFFFNLAPFTLNKVCGLQPKAHKTFVHCVVSLALSAVLLWRWNEERFAFYQVPGKWFNIPDGSFFMCGLSLQKWKNKIEVAWKVHVDVNVDVDVLILLSVSLSTDYWLITVRALLSCL